MIHPLSDCMCENIPNSTNVWQFCVIFPYAKIGENCNICSHCLIENEVVIGNNCTIKCGVQLWNGVILEDNVFVGANVTFTNDLYPRSKNLEWTLLTTIVHKGAFNRCRSHHTFRNRNRRECYGWRRFSCYKKHSCRRNLGR